MPPTIRFARPARMAGVELLQVSEHPEGQSPVLEQYLIAAYTRDHADVRYRRWDLTVGDGTMQLCEPGEVVRCVRQHRPWSATGLFLEPSVVRQAAQELGVAECPHFVTPAVRDAECFRVLSKLSATIERGDPLRDQEATVVEALRLILERYAEARPRQRSSDPGSVERAREFLHAHWRDEVRLDELARASWMSKYELVRQFREQVGLPPHQYLLQLRIARARRMLAGGVPISRAAMECGFSAQSHLHRHFVRSVGVTPGQYRRSVA